VVFSKSARSEKSKKRDGASGLAVSCRATSEEVSSYNPAMLLDEEARRYADTLFTNHLDESSRKYHAEVVATTNLLAARGLATSGPFYSELVRLGVGHIRELAHARADTLIAAYPRARTPFDAEAAEEITREVTEYCEVQGGNLAKNIKEKATRAGMQSLCEALAGSVATEMSSVEAQVRRKLLTKSYEARLDSRNSPQTVTPPEQLDDLLPISPTTVRSGPDPVSRDCE
jgi:hypothetical protein